MKPTVVATLASALGVEPHRGPGPVTGGPHAPGGTAPGRGTRGGPRFRVEEGRRGAGGGRPVLREPLESLPRHARA